MWGAGCCGPPRAPATGPPSRGRASCPRSPLGTALTSAVCTLPCLGPCYSQSSGSSCPSGQVQTHSIRGGHRDLVSGLSVEGHVGGGGRETPPHPSLTGQCPVPLGPCLWTVLCRRTGNKSRQLHRQGGRENALSVRGSWALQFIVLLFSSCCFFSTSRWDLCPWLSH